MKSIDTGSGINQNSKGKGLSVFEKYLTLWVALSIAGGIILGKIAPELAKSLDGLSIYVGKAPVVSIPIAICLYDVSDYGQDRFCRGSKGRQKY